MSGGGTGIVVFPVFLSMGMPFPLVSAITVVDSAIWVLPAARNYLKGRVIDWPLILIFSLVGLVGCYLGVLLVIDVNQRILEICVGIIILIIIGYTYLKKDLGLTEHKIYSRPRQAIAYPFSLASNC
jgi:uncharacterized membrane protein YfcA